MDHRPASSLSPPALHLSWKAFVKAHFRHRVRMVRRDDSNAIARVNAALHDAFGPAVAIASREAPPPQSWCLTAVLGPYDDGSDELYRHLCTNSDEIAVYARCLTDG